MSTDDKCANCGNDFNGPRIFFGGASPMNPEHDIYICNDCYQKKTGFRWMGYNICLENF